MIKDVHNCCKVGVVFLLHPDHAPLFFVDKCTWSNYVLKSTWASLTNVWATSTTPLTLMPNWWTINIWSLVIFSPQTITLMCPSLVGSHVCKYYFSRVSRGIVHWIINKPPKPIRFAHCHSLDPIRIHCNFLNFFCFRKYLFSNYFGKWTALLHLFFSLTPHHELGLCFGRYNNRYVRGIRFHVKESSFKQCWWKLYQLLNFDRLFNFNFSLCSWVQLLFNLYFLLKITNCNECKCRRWNVFLKAS